MPDFRNMSKDDMRAEFNELFTLNVNDHTEKIEQNGRKFTYLSWAWAWAEVKKIHPDAMYVIKENPATGQHFWLDEKLGYEVRTSVTIDGLTHDMWLPVMDSSNHAMKDKPYTYKVKNKNHQYAKLDRETGKWLDRYGNEQPEYLVKTVEQASMMDVNKAIMRCLVKNLAMFGLGLYIYSGEDLPESTSEGDGKEETENSPSSEEKAAKPTKTASKAQIQFIHKLYTPEEIEKMLNNINRKNQEEGKPIIPDIGAIPLPMASKMIEARSVK